MRMTRTLAALVAIIASFALAISLAPAHAEEGATTQATFGRFNAELIKGKLVAKGQASNWKRKVVQIQRAPRGTNNWTTIAQPKTDARGNFRVVLQPGSDIPCTGKKFKVRAKKKGRPAAKVDDDLWYCG